jgi:molybdopterin-containing oxidoreductase family membrane subunit
MISCNVVSAPALLEQGDRTNVVVVFDRLPFLVTIGMWFERFVIIVTSLHRAFLPGEWHMFSPDAGRHRHLRRSPCGVFMTLFLLFLRFLPCLPHCRNQGRPARRPARTIMAITRHDSRNHADRSLTVGTH